MSLPPDFSYIGYWHKYCFRNSGFLLLKERHIQELRVYANSVLLRTFFPNIKFSFASAVFDFSPQLTVGIVRMVIGLLEQARFDAENLNQHTDGIYSIVNCFSQIQSPPHFIRMFCETSSALLTPEFGFSVMNTAVSDRIFGIADRTHHDVPHYC